MAANSGDQPLTLGATIIGGSETLYEFLCDECWEDGKDTEGVGYCLDCQEYLCTECLAVHRKTKLTRRHALLDQDAMPRDKPQTMVKETQQDMCTDICQEHRAEIVKYYCEEHDTFGCTVCVTIKHRNCEGVGYIPQQAENLINNDEYNALKNGLHNMSDRLQHVTDGATENIPKAEQFCNNAVSAVLHLKEQVNEVMKALEISVIEQVNRIKTGDVDVMENVKSKTDDQVRIVQRLMTKLNSLQDDKQMCRLFVVMKESKREIGSLQRNLEEMERLNTIKEYAFTPTDVFLDSLKVPSNIGKISMIEQDVQVHINANDANQQTDAGADQTIEGIVVLVDQMESHDIKPEFNVDETVKVIENVTQQVNEIETTETTESKRGIEDTQLDAASSGSLQSVPTGQHEPQDDDIETSKCVSAEENDTDLLEIAGDTHVDAIRYPPTNDKDLLEIAGETHVDAIRYPPTNDVAEKDTEAKTQMAGDTQNLYLLPRTEKAETSAGPAEVTATPSTDILVKTVTDTSTCYISGCVLLPSNKLLLSDFNNVKVKMFDSVLGTLVDLLRTDSAPWEIADVGGVKAAVTLPYRNKILLLSVTNTLKTDKEISVSGNCRGIVCHKDQLIISYTSPPKMEIVDFDGKLLKTLVSEGRASILLGVPYHVTIRREDAILYVTNNDDGKIISLALDGRVNAECAGLKYPRGLHVDARGFVYVCARDFHYVYLMTPECRHVKTLLTKADGLWYPMSACCDAENRKLYVGMNEDTVKVFQLT